MGGPLVTILGSLFHTSLGASELATLKRRRCLGVLGNLLFVQLNWLGNVHDIIFLKCLYIPCPAGYDFHGVERLASLRP
jgi:hypothetical protein